MLTDISNESVGLKKGNTINWYQVAKLLFFMRIKRATGEMTKDDELQLLEACPASVPPSILLTIAFSSNACDSNEALLILLKRLNNDQKFEEVSEIFNYVEVALTLALAIEFLYAASLTKNISLCKDVVSALKKQSLDVPEEILDMAIDAAFKASQPSQALAFFRMIPGKANSKSLSLMVRGYARGNQLGQAIEFYDLIRADSLFLDSAFSVNSIIDCCFKQGYFEKVTEIFSYQKSEIETIDLYTYSSVVKSYCRSGKLDMAFEIFKGMKDQIEPDEVLYNSLIDGCSKAGRLEEAFDLLAEMRQGSVATGVVTFNTLIDACVRKENMERAWEVLEEMKIQNIEPDNYTYSTLFKGIKDETHQSHLSRSLELLDQLEKDPNFFPDAILYNVLLDACVSARMMTKAQELFERMETSDSKVKPDEISYNTLIKGCGYTKDLLRAFDLFQSMKEKSVKPNEVTFNSLIDVCVRCNRLEKGWNLLEEMETSGLIPDSFTYSTIIKGMHRSYGGNNEEQLEKAFGLLTRMKTVTMVKPDEILYNCLMDACVRFHSTERALNVFDEMIKSGICPSSITYGILIKAYGQSGNLTNALSTFSKMKREGFIPNTVTYGCLIDACIRNENLARGLEIYETMKKDGVEPNT